MIIHPALRALRSDDAPQRVAQESLIRAVRTWREQPDVADLICQVADFAEGRPLSGLPALTALFEAGNPAAKRLTSDFAAMASRALVAAPLGRLPMRHNAGGNSATLLLARSGNVTLSLSVVDGLALADQPAPDSVSFAPMESWEHILAGHGVALMIECCPTGPQSAKLRRSVEPLQPGKILRRDGARVARILTSVDNSLVTLRLQRRPVDAGPAREYHLASGRLMRQAAGNPRDSRIEMMMALLGRMARSDAAPLMAQLAREVGSAALRWQALRECLALDTQQGFAALTAIAVDPGDPLAGAAGKLRAQLIESWPQLEELEACPA
jgi:hypothetical protein